MIDKKEDYNYDGLSIRRPIFYELFPEWEQTLLRQEGYKAVKRNITL
jgi:hypothetical protein